MSEFGGSTWRARMRHLPVGLVMHWIALAIAGQCLGIKVIGSSFSLGPAYTMRCLPVGIDGGSIGDYIDDVSEPGSVAVIDNAGRA